MPRTRRSPRRRWAANVALVVASCASVAICVAIVVLRIGFTPVLSDSMSPTFDAGAVVITMPRDVDELAVGDVAVLPFPDDSGVRYAHRIVERTERDGRVEVVTRGDANDSADDWRLAITSDSVPVVIASIPHLGWTNDLLGSNRLRLVLVAGVVVASVVGIRRAVRNARRVGRSPGRVDP